MKCCLIDFEDSFTYNLVQELSEANFSVEVIHWKDFITLPSDDLLVLGPGPGHPDEYQRIFPLIQSWLSMDKPLFGVCLGHQIFWRLRGESVQRSLRPLHGQRIELNPSQEWRQWLDIEGKLIVQRYNSLMVGGDVGDRNLDLINFVHDDEVLITRSKRILTYQFHPESVGTTYRRKLIRAIYNILT